jgi:hypothetical protein
MSEKYNAREWEAYERQLEARQLKLEPLLRRWKLISLGLGTTLILNCFLLALFADGHPWHRLWDGVGKRLLLFCMFLLIPLSYAILNTLNLLVYLRQVKRIFGDLHSETRGRN